jgi:methylmalonyl-CoA mutase cobalamin-binding subunit
VLLADEPPLTPAERVYQRLLAFDYQEPLKLARNHIKAASLAEFYDDIAIPALILAERDRHAGLLNEDQEAFVHEAADDLVEEVGEIEANEDTVVAPIDALPTEPGRPSTPAVPARILCIPLRDAADETTSRMLGQLLHNEGFDVAHSRAGTLTSEMVDRVAESDSDVVVISVLPPIRPRDSRLLWKKLRQAYPNLPIVVGYWIGPNATESLIPPRGDANSRVATTLSEAVALVRSIAVKTKLANAASA